MATPRLILGSGSPQRLALLRQINIEPDIVDAPDIDEILQKGEKARAYVARMALEKNQALHDKYPNDFILTGDTTVAVGRRILEKAKDEAQAREFLTLLSGRSHKVLSAVTIRDPDGQLVSRLSDNKVQFKRLTQWEIDQYIARDDFQKTAGYRIKHTEHLISAMHGSYSGILGLPLYETYQLLSGLGYFNR